MVDSTIRWVNAVQNGISVKQHDISSVNVGETMIVAMLMGSSTITMDPPSGWSSFFTRTVLGSRACLVFYRVKEEASELSVTFTSSADTVSSSALMAVTGSTPDDWVVGPIWTRSAHGTSTTNIIDGVTTVDPDTLALVISFEATSASEDPNTVAGVDNGFVELGYIPQGTTIETIWAGTKLIPTPGDVGDTTVTYRNTQASNGAGIMFGLGQGSFIPMGSRLRMGNGSFARLSYINELGERSAPASMRVLKPGFDNVSTVQATPGFTMAHRGGSDNFPEMSEYAYDQSILRGFGVIEFSAQRTIDGWWFGCHNPDINEVTGETGLPLVSEMTRAEVEEYSNITNPTTANPSRPFYGLEEFLLKYGKNYVLVVDPKNALSFNSEFLSICENIVDKSRLIWKYNLGGVGSVGPSNGAQMAVNRGWGGTWGFAYNTDIDNGAFAEHAAKPAWTMLGMNIGADQSYWDTALALGKPVIGHIARSQAEYDTGIAKGADGIQCADVVGITPISI